MRTDSLARPASPRDRSPRRSSSRGVRLAAGRQWTPPTARFGPSEALVVLLVRDLLEPGRGAQGDRVVQQVGVRSRAVPVLLAGRGIDDVPCRQRAPAAVPGSHAAVAVRDVQDLAVAVAVPERARARLEEHAADVYAAFGVGEDRVRPAR